MWICLNNAFVSAVEHNSDPTLLVVRARVSGHLEAFFDGTIPAAELNVEVHPERDYLYRTIVRRHAFADALSHHAVNSIDYGNFKDSVENDALHDAYSRVWGVMLGLQDRGKYVRPLFTDDEQAGFIASEYARADEVGHYIPKDFWPRQTLLPDPVIEPKAGKIKPAKKRQGGKAAKTRRPMDDDGPMASRFGDDYKPTKKKGAKRGKRSNKKS